MDLADSELLAELEALWDLQQTYGHWPSAQCKYPCWVCERVDTLEALLYGLDPERARIEREAFWMPKSHYDTLPQWGLLVEEDVTIELRAPAVPRIEPPSGVPLSEPNPYLDWPPNWRFPKVG